MFIGTCFKISLLQIKLIVTTLIIIITFYETKKKNTIINACLIFTKQQEAGMESGWMDVNGSNALGAAGTEKALSRFVAVVPVVQAEHRGSFSVWFRDSRLRSATLLPGFPPHDVESAVLVEVPTAVTSPSRPGQLGNVLCGFRVLGVKWGSFDSSRVKQFGKEPQEWGGRQGGEVGVQPH